jgi:hypothetical protein
MRIGDFWGFLDDVEPGLASWPVGELVRLVDAIDNAVTEDPFLAVERAAGRSLTVEERGMVMLKVLAPQELGTPPRPLRITFARIAEMTDPWSVAISAGALGTKH